MADAVFLFVMVAGTRLVYSLMSLCTASARERAWAHALTTLLRAAGPGDVIEYARRDGNLVITRAAAGAADQAAGR